MNNNTKEAKTMKKYRVKFWEKVRVWVYQDMTIETDEKPTSENLQKLIDTCNVDYESDYSWDTLEHNDYDFTTEFEVEEVK